MKIELETLDIEKLSTEITRKVLDGLKYTMVPVSSPAKDEIFTVETLAAYLMTTPKWVYNHIHELPHFKIDGLLRFKKRVIDQFFEQNPAKCSKAQ